MSFPPFGCGLRRSSPVDPFFVDPFYSDISLPRFGFGDNSAFAAVADARVDWRQTREARVFKADLPRQHKRGCKAEVGSAVQIRGERNCRCEKKTNTQHRVERAEKTDTRLRVERKKKIEIRHRVEREKTTEIRHRVERGKKAETWHCVEREKKIETWHCVEREKKTDTRPRVPRQKKTDSGEVVRRFRLPANVKANQVEIAMENRMLTVTVPKEAVKKPRGKSIKISGIVPGLHRQCVFGGLRIGLYEPVRNFYVGENHVGDVPLSKKILAGLTTGALGITVANPTDLVKVRLQAEGKLPPGVPRRYSGALNAYSTIVRQEGFGALWTGLGPNIARNAIINAAELASYDEVKQTILKIPGFTDNVFTHLLSGLGAGFFAVCIGSPVDVVKSRMMGDSAYKSTIDCFVKTMKNEGPLAFYKGFLPNFGRLGSWNVIMFLTLEQVKKLFAKEVPDKH